MQLPAMYFVSSCSLQPASTDAPPVTYDSRSSVWKVVLHGSQLQLASAPADLMVALAQFTAGKVQPGREA